MSGQLQHLKQENTSLKEELQSLKQKHDYTIMELTDAHQNQSRLRSVNQTLLLTLQNNPSDLKSPSSIHLVLEGESISDKISELQRQLDRHRNGVNASVDRRVREIIQGYQQLQENDRYKDKGSDNNFKINYNVIHESSGEQCSTCRYLEGIIAQRDKRIKEISDDLQEQVADTGILSSKLYQMEALVDTLKKQNRLLQKQISSLEYQVSQEKENREKSSRQTYQDISYDSRQSMPTLDRAVSDYKEKEHMMREISNIAHVFSSRKVPEEKSKSRVVDGSALFSIKNGINRPSQRFVI